MKDSALVVVDLPGGGDVEGTLKAIEKLTAGTEADDTGIHSTYPILFVRDPVHKVHESLQPYVKEHLTFIDDANPAGQSLCEVLSLLEVSRVLVGGIGPEDDIRTLAQDLQKAGFEVTLLNQAGT